MFSLKKFRDSLVTRTVLCFLAGILLVAVPPLVVLYRMIRHNLTVTLKDEATLLCQYNVTQFEQDFLKWETGGKILAARLEGHWDNLTPAVIRKALEDTMLSVDSASAAVAAIEPGALTEGDGKPLMLMLSRGENGTKWSERQDFLVEDWYLRVKETGEAQWLPLFTGRVMEGLIASYAVPLYRRSSEGTKQFIGVVYIDVLCSALQKTVDNFHAPGDGYAFVLSRDQRVLACRFKRNLGKKLIELTDYQTKLNFEEFSEKLSQGQPVWTSAENLVTGDKLHIFCEPMENTGWVFALVFPDTMRAMLVGTFHHTFGLMIAVACGIVALLGLLLYFFMSVPLRKARDFAQAIGEGHLDESAPQATGNSEIPTLVHTIDNMRNSLKEHIANVQEMTKQQVRAANELVVAKNIQLGILPDRGGEAFSNKAFAVAADMTPAREVGGDMYDVVLLSPTKLFIAIGDVSGKGIPAAMVMVVTQTLMRGLLQSDEVSPAKLVTALNDKLCVYKNLKSFITYFLGILDLESGVLTYCNAGHNPFLVLKADGSVETPCQRNGIPVGVKPGYAYTESQCNLGKGDAILLYTDGVVEAENTQHQFFGMDRLREVAKRCAAVDATPEEIGQTLAQTLADFSARAEQHDDMSYLCVRRNDG